MTRSYCHLSANFTNIQCFPLLLDKLVRFCWCAVWCRNDDQGRQRDETQNDEQAPSCFTFDNHCVCGQAKRSHLPPVPSTISCLFMQKDKLWARKARNKGFVTDFVPYKGIGLFKFLKWTTWFWQMICLHLTFKNQNRRKTDFCPVLIHCLVLVQHRGSEAFSEPKENLHVPCPKKYWCVQNAMCFTQKPRVRKQCGIKVQ